MRKIQKKYCIEELISRIPSLFPYIEFNELDLVEYHKATDSPQGSYGKIMPSFEIGGKTMTYRTMFNTYYDIKKGLKEDYQIVFENEEKSFTEIIEYGIGKIKVENDEFKDCVKVPSYVFLSQVKTLLDIMKKKQKTVRMYEAAGDMNDDICCFIKEYEAMGGDKFVDYLINILPDSEERANVLFSELLSRNGNVLSFNLQLTNKIKDFGYYTPYTNKWSPGQQLKKGELFTYTDADGFTDTYVAMNDTSGVYDSNLLRVVFDEENMKKLTEVGNSYFDLFDDEQKKRLEERFKGRKVKVGVDSNSVFNPDSFDIETSDYKIKGNVDSKLKSLRRFITYTNIFDDPETPNSGEDWLFYYRKGVIVNYNIKQDDNGHILFLDGEVEEKDETKVINLMAYGDSIIDITPNKDEYTITFEYILDAHLYGLYEDSDRPERTYSNFSIDLDSKYGKYTGVKYTETFNYTPNSELDYLVNGCYGLPFKAGDTLKEGTYKVTQGTLKVDTETYETGSVFDVDEKGVNIGEAQEDVVVYKYDEDAFNNYIEGTDNGVTKYAFTTVNSKTSYNKRIDTQIASVAYQNAEFETLIENNTDNMYMQVFKEPYLSNIHFKPMVENDVFIRRGNNAAFERHLKLGEIKTLEDLSTTQNGSFFKQQTQ